MTIILSCGHEDKDIPHGINIVVKSDFIDHYERRIKNSIDYLTICKNCFLEYYDEDYQELLFTKEQEDNYLNMN